MSYIKIDIQVHSSEQLEILIAELSEINFDAFEENENSLSAFIKKKNFNEELLNKILPKHVSYKKTIIKNTNWNATWESECKPIIVKDFVAIRASFHKPISNVKHEIIITPKMSFGTGHHATTYLMLQHMQSIDFLNKSVLDFGTGTGILAIMAKKSGAKKVVAIDYDEWSINNAKENFIANNCTGIVLLQQDNLCGPETFDIILANINVNVIMGSIQQFKHVGHPSSVLLLSGFLKPDEKRIIHHFSLEGFKYKNRLQKSEWSTILLTKS